MLKPLDPARLAQALDRVRERLAAASAPPPSAPTDGLRVIAQSQVFLKDGET
ncbi:MAG: hypothetical protein H7330_06975 [Hymenobacteraceae bacterium]|nr:hypothetical protein [Hymenobacteraceae bacterium]